MSNAVHEFKESLRYSAQFEDFWSRYYRTVFPTVARIENCAANMADQKRGIDRRLTLTSGQVITLDEKIRNRRYHGDVLIEYGHFTERVGGQKVAPGWIEKNLAINYIAIGYPPSRRAILLDWHTLQRAWESYRGRWLFWAERSMDGFAVAVAQNRDYWTRSVCVPTSALYGAMFDAGHIQIEWDTVLDRESPPCP